MNVLAQRWAGGRTYGWKEMHVDSYIGRQIRERYVGFVGGWMYLYVKRQVNRHLDER